MASMSAPTTTANTVVDDGLEEYPGQRNERTYGPNGEPAPAGTVYPPQGNGATAEIKQRLPYLLNTRRFGSHICTCADKSRC